MPPAPRSSQTTVSIPMGRKELHSSDVKIEQKDPISDTRKYAEEGDIVLVNSADNQPWLDELAFNEEPVTIRIEPSADKFAAAAYPVWNNGKGAEVFQGGRWDEIGYLPVGRILTVKRKTVATMAGAKFDRINTEVVEVQGENPNNLIKRFTSASVSFSVLEDKNPRGGAWLTELVRRNM